MNSKWVQSLIMGFVTGFCEPMPLSGQAHRGLLHMMFANEADTALLMLLSRVAVLVVLMMSGRLEISRLRRARKLERTPARRRSAQPDLMSLNTLKYIRMPALMVVIARLGAFYLDGIGDKLWQLPIFLILGGVLLWFPTQLRTGNKDARNMEQVDGMLMGIGAALSAFPGVSLVGSAMSLGSSQGVSRRYALRFAWLLVVVSLGTGIALDLFTLLTAGFELEMLEILYAVLGAVGAAVGAYLAVHTMYSLNRSVGISWFCYYHWGVALLCLILFLLV